MIPRFFKRFGCILWFYAIPAVFASVTPVITWPIPAPITYGTRLLGTNQLNASATYAGTNVPGTFTYTPAHGAILYAGTNLLSAVFTPADTTDYTGPTGSVSLVVLPVPLVIAANNAAITYGQAIPGFTDAFNGLRNGDAITATNSSTATAGSPPGYYPIIPAIVDPNNSETNYIVSLVNGWLAIVPPGTLLAWATPSNINYGAALTTNQLDALPLVSGTVVYSPALGTVPGTGTNLLSAVLTPTDTTDYSTVTNTVNLVVSPAPLNVTVANATRGVGQANPVFTGTVTGLVNGDSISATYASSATTTSPAGTYPILATMVDPNLQLANYSLTISNGVLTVTNTPPLILAAPTNQTANSGNIAMFSVTAAGSSPLNYQWSFNGTNLADNSQITGSQSNLLTLAIVGPTNGGTYQVTVSNLYGATNLAATLTVLSTGSWTPLASLAPGDVGTMLLLSDGTVMGQDANGGTAWYHLSPTTNGGYLKGKWTKDIPAMHSARLYYSSDVLQDGRVFIAGAEYGLGTTNAEIYDPVAKAWTLLTVPAGLISTNNAEQSDGANNSGFLDSASVVLSNGKVLITPVYPASFGETVIYDPVSNIWSSAKLVRGSDEDEASLVKLPDDSILVVDFNSTSSERFIPSLNRWITDSSLPVQVYDSYGKELGASFLLPNGKVLQIGAAPNYAIYTPTGTIAPGSWAGASQPNNLAAPDAPAAMMPNGKVLCVLSPAPNATNVFTSPSYFYEYDYSAGALGTFIPTSAPGGGSNINDVTYNDRMLVLPDGTVLFSSGGTQLYLYTPYGPPLPAGQPAISSVTQNPDGSFLLSGTGLNGISQGAAYGDDAQMDSNYPLVRMTNNITGLVYYARTYNWSRTSVMTGTNLVTTQFTIPATVPGGLYSLSVVANGNPSAAIAFPVNQFSYTTNSGTLTITGFAGPASNQAIPSSINGLLVTAIANNAFAGNTNLTSITIPAGVINIGASAFANNPHLASVYFLGSPPAVPSSAFSLDNLATVYYLAGTGNWTAFSTVTALKTMQWDPLGPSGRIKFIVQSNDFGFSFTGPASLAIVIQATTNALGTVWIPLQTNLLTGGVFSFNEPLLTNAPSRYYRITSQ